MVNNSKSTNAATNAATNVKPAGKLEGTGLAGANGNQAKSANKMNIVANKLIKALNKYMEAPKDAKESTNKKEESANKKNAASATNTPSTNGKPAPSAETNKTSKNGKPASVETANSQANNTVNVINPLEKTANKPVNATPNKNATNALATRRSRAAFMKAQTFKGGRRTKYNKNKSRKNLKRSRTHRNRA